MTKKELERRVFFLERSTHRFIRQLHYAEKLIAAARAYRILDKNLSWGPDGCLNCSEDHEFLELTKRKLDERLEEWTKHPWLWEKENGKSDKKGSTKKK
jgi:hypothetical protein